MIVGILGGIGSGKSTVTRLFVELGAEAVDADRLAHEVLDSPSARQAVQEWLGEEVLLEDGKVDRQRVARAAFRTEENLKRLEKIIHPEVLRRVEVEIRRHRERARGQGLLVLDVPLLASLPLRGECDALVFVDAKAEVRHRRAVERGLDVGEIARREGFQASLEEKRRMADFVMDNSGSLEETREQVKACHARLNELAATRARPSATKEQ
jgi:dephospho-CoA kinase